MDAKDVSMALFLTRSVPMERWQKIGTLERETLYYIELANRFRQISFVTCGGRNELDFAPAKDNINVLHNKPNISPNWYSLFVPIIHRHPLSQIDVYKTNQCDGAWTAIIAGWMFHKPVVVRTGYIWSEVFRQEINAGIKAHLVEILEKWCLSKAKHIFVTTDDIKIHYCRKYALPGSKITIIPNYIDTRIFHPDPENQPVSGRICYVGRLAPVKNLNLLIHAISQISSTSLTIVGKGKQMDELKVLADNLYANVEFLGQVDNRKLPEILHQSEIFVLPSSIEGHPKALIEAMACGCAVIGADVPGIRNLIQHNENGLLCPPTVDGIRDAIITLMKNDGLKQNLSNNAAIFAANHFSLEKIVALETQSIMDCLLISDKG